MNEPKRQLLFIALSTYLVPEEVILDHLVEHRAWTKKAFDDGVMLFTGRQDPPTGGVLCFRAPDRDAAERFVAQDPFVTSGVAEISVTALTPTQLPWRSEAVQQFLDADELIQQG